MSCWYCHWGWAKEVAEIYKAAVEQLDGDNIALHHGPGHIVWDDENFDSASIRWCIYHFDENLGDLTDREKFIVRLSLLELLAIPEHQRDIEPKEYDGNPENYPPKCEVVRV